MKKSLFFLCYALFLTLSLQGQNENEIDGKYTMIIKNAEKQITNTGSITIHHEEIPEYVINISYNKGNQKTATVNAKFKNNVLKGNFKGNSAKKIELKFKPNIQQFKGKIKEVLADGSVETSYIILDRKN